MERCNSNTLEVKIVAAAKALGFDVCKITPARLPIKIAEDLQGYIAKGHHGSMDWMAETSKRRASPLNLWNEAQTAIILAMNYGPETNPQEGLECPNAGVISTYARHRDYHEIIKGKLKTLAGKLVSWHQCEVKVFVDTAPLMEKPLAAQAGIGWQGKHTNLVSREFGSWLFLGSILTNAKLMPIDEPGEQNNCGTCRSCLDICPTMAFTSAHKIDARRCISYLTIENKGHIPLEFRKLIGNRIFGCDDCLAVCPWNKFAQAGREQKLRARDDLLLPELAFLGQLDDPQFRKFFTASPVKRIGRDRFIRNVLIAIGNSGNEKFVGLVKSHLDDDNAIVRAAAIWALRMLMDEDNVAVIRKFYLASEQDQSVVNEWSCDLGIKHR